MLTIKRYGVLFSAQTQDGIKNCMARYYALPRSKRKGVFTVTTATMWKTAKYHHKKLSQ